MEVIRSIIGIFGNIIYFFKRLGNVAKYNLSGKEYLWNFVGTLQTTTFQGLSSKVQNWKDRITKWPNVK